ncbi:MAG TPA: acyl-CoA dehydrogenase family protein, partial [Burkholderiales bacterium]
MELPGLRFALGEHIDMLRGTVREFAAAEIAPRAAEIDRSNQVPPDLWPDRRAHAPGEGRDGARLRSACAGECRGAAARC